MNNSVPEPTRYQVKLPHFEGPFDLLLFFIKRDELDVYDIPIAQVTQDFLVYIHQQKIMNLEVASEFILMVSTLMRIKSKMLLPRPTLDEFGNETDPREELVQHLLTYKKYKSVVPIFAALEAEQQSRYPRVYALNEIKQLTKSTDLFVEMQHIDLFKIMKAYNKAHQRFKMNKQQPIQQVIPLPYTIEEQRNTLLAQLSEQSKLSFTDLMDQSPDKLLIIFNFLAILDLLQLGEIQITLGEGYNNFWISLKEI